MQISASCASKSSGAGEIGLVGGDEGQLARVGEIEQQRLDRPLLRQAMALQLDIESVAEVGLQCFEARAGEIGTAGGEGRVDRPRRGRR